jgi:hypothetical protein
MSSIISALRSKLSRAVKPINGVVLFLAGLAAIGSFAYTLHKTEDSPPSTRIHASATPLSVSSSSTTDTAGALPLAVGDCLPSSLDRTIRCDISHQYQVVANGACTVDALVQFLGGRPGVEVINVEPKVLELKPAGKACAVTDPTAPVVVTSARNALQSGGSGWRRCRDDRIGADVPCAQLHTAEYVLTASASVVDCDQAASTYLNAPPLRFKGRLQVETLQSSAGPICLVAVQGADLLTATIRNIGTSSLPLTSP